MSNEKNTVFKKNKFFRIWTADVACGVETREKEKEEAPT